VSYQGAHVQEVRQERIVLLGQHDVPRAPVTDDTGDVAVAHGVAQAPGSLSPQLSLADKCVRVWPPCGAIAPRPGPLALLRA